MNPFTLKTDHNLSSPHEINTPTNMVSIRIIENLNWRIIFCSKCNVASNPRNRDILISWKNFLQNLGVHELI